jgi:hypothetical protein
MFSRIFHFIDAPRHVVTKFQDLLQGAAVFSFQAVQGSEPRFHIFQASGVAL